MATTKVYNMQGQVIGEIELMDSVFGIEPNVVAMHTMVKNYLANQRHGTHSTLTRAEVSGGGKKPYKQKGTGRARQGSTRSPQWTHGGIAFGPKPREYRYSVNRKLNQLAIRSALSDAFQSGKLVVVDKLELPEIKTKSMVSFIDSIGTARKPLIVTPEVNKNVIFSSRNIPGAKTTISSILCVYDIVNADKFIVDKAAIEKIQEVYAQ